MPSVFDLQIGCPPGVITITPPSPPFNAGSSEWIIWSAACCGVLPSCTSVQISLASVSRMKYSPTPVPETAQDLSLA
jgi:hypothetical protein